MGQLEASVRKLAAQSESVHVVTGPIFDSQALEFIGNGWVAVPTHTYKWFLLYRVTAK